jgi:Putative zinc-finger
MMNCTDCEKFLEEYLDGELAARDAAETEAHLASCEACAGAYDALTSEQNLYAAYERPVEVSPRLWGGVEARINAGKTGGEVGLLQKLSAWFAPLLTAPRFSPALTAALVVAAIALTVGVMKLTGPHAQPSNDIARNDRLNVNNNAKPAPQSNTDATQRPTQTTPASVNGSPDNSSNKSDPGGTAEPKPSPETRKNPANEQRNRVVPVLRDGGQLQQAGNVIRQQGPPTPEQLVAEAEQRYIAAINMLQRDMAKKRTSLDPQTVARFDESLAAVDRSIAETRRAVKQHGDDPIAAQYMLSAYAKKVEVLREMAHLQQ